MSATERTVQVAATAMSIFLSGLISSISMVTVPAILSTPITNDVLLKQWKMIYDKGSKLGPAIAMPAAIVHGWVSYSKWTRGEDPTSSLLAAVFTIGIAPYTWAAMLPTNNQLMCGANKGEKQGDARNLVEHWMWLNGVRGLLPMIGGVLSLIDIAR